MLFYKAIVYFPYWSKWWRPKTSWLSAHQVDYGPVKQHICPAKASIISCGDQISIDAHEIKMMHRESKWRLWVYAMFSNLLWIPHAHQRCKIFHVVFRERERDHFSYGGRFCLTFFKKLKLENKIQHFCSLFPSSLQIKDFSVKNQTA